MGATIETRRRRTEVVRDSSTVDVVVGAILFDRFRRAVGRRGRRRHDGRRRRTGGRRHGNGRRPGGPAVAGRQQLRHLRDRRRRTGLVRHRVQQAQLVGGHHERPAAVGQRTDGRVVVGGGRRLRLQPSVVDRRRPVVTGPVHVHRCGRGGRHHGRETHLFFLPPPPQPPLPLFALVVRTIERRHAHAVRLVARHLRLPLRRAGRRHLRVIVPDGRPDERPDHIDGERFTLFETTAYCFLFCYASVAGGRAEGQRGSMEMGGGSHPGVANVTVLALKRII